MPPPGNGSGPDDPVKKPGSQNPPNTPASGHGVPKTPNPGSHGYVQGNTPTGSTQVTGTVGVNGDSMMTPRVDPNAYYNPVGNQAPAWQEGMKNFLGATTGPAAQMGYVNAGPIATYGGAQMDKGQYGQSWNAQWGLANQLGAMAQGNGPSMAQVQAQQSQQANLANQMAAMGGQRGAGNPALAQYQAQQLGAQGMQQAAQQAVQGRTQEEMQALQAQGQLYGNLNQQAQQFSGNQAQLQQQAQLASMGAINQGNQYQAGLYQQANQANLGAQQGQQAMNAQEYNNYMSMLEQQNMAQWQAAMQQQQQQSSNYLTAAGIRQGISINQANIDYSAAQNAANGAGAVITTAAQAFSDQRVKKNIVLGEQILDKNLEEIYKSPGKLKFLMLI